MPDKSDQQKAQEKQLEAQQKMVQRASAPSAGGPSEEDQKRATQLAEEQAARQEADPRTPESPSASVGVARGEEGQRRGRTRRVRAQQDMSHTDANGDVVAQARAGELLDEDNPLVELHPHMFERFE